MSVTGEVSKRSGRVRRLASGQLVDEEGKPFCFEERFRDVREHFKRMGITTEEHVAAIIREIKEEKRRRRAKG